MKNNFRRFGTMIDCSRNAVISVEAIKRWIDITSDIGYNTVMLYTEDTFEIKDEPFFGYLRGRYSVEELIEIDNYAAKKNMEFIPCIQTLAHLNSIFHWKKYKETIWDCADILLAEEEETYVLIDKMFKTLSQNLRTNIINIGMDEAHSLGLGKYLDKHGYQERTQILINHLKVVSKIAEKYDLKLIMWGDMFVRIANGGEYYVTDFKAPKEVRDSIPANIDIIYWDYYSFDKEKYDRMIKAHSSIKENIWFAGGLWTWGSFVPRNSFSIEANKSALVSCLENGVKDVFLTLWGDDGGECSVFSAIPSLFHAAQIANGVTDESVIRENFKEKFGINFDDFLLLDLVGTPTICDNMCSDKDLRNPEKYMLYNDCFMGQFDGFINEGEALTYKAAAQNLKLFENNEKFGYLFKKERALCELLSVKYDIGLKTRKAYQNKEIDMLKKLISDYGLILQKLDDFYKEYKNQWFIENKPNGFDIQDIRLGGLSWRIRSCRDRLQQFVDGKINIIEELEDNILDLTKEGFEKTHIFETQWCHMASVNVMSHNVF